MDERAFALSALDEERFGIRTARAPALTAALVPVVLERCRVEGVRLLIARCPVSDLAAAQALERAGAFLTDTLLYWVRDLVKNPLPPDEGGVEIRPVRPGEEAEVKAVAAESFRGYFGHYHADPRLDRAKCDEAYASWALRSCAGGGAADEVLVAAAEEGVVGFATVRMNSPEEGEVVLNGVAPSAQRRGIYRSLLLKALAWCREKACARMVISTQVMNYAVQKVWARLGFTLDRGYHTFHKWFD